MAGIGGRVTENPSQEEAQPAEVDASSFCMRRRGRPGTMAHVMIQAQPSPQPRQAAIAFILVTVVLDMLSFGIIIPVLPKLVEEFGRRRRWRPKFTASWERRGR